MQGQTGAMQKFYPQEAASIGLDGGQGKKLLGKSAAMHGPVLTRELPGQAVKAPGDIGASENGF